MRRVAWRRTRDSRAAALPLAVLAGAGLAAAARSAWRRSAAIDLSGRAALVTGATRGLGLAVARELVAQGCRQVAICGRDESHLARAADELEARGAEVAAVACDVGDQAAVQRMVESVTTRFGRLDLLVNNAGEMEVCAHRQLRLDDFRRAMDVMFWGVVHVTEAALPALRARPGARVVNVTSIGGRISVPHMLPYSCAKFAAVAYSEGLRAELAPDGVAVTTVVPGLMRTGSYLQARFRSEREYGLFALLANAPLLSVDARRAARRIVNAARRGDAELILTPAAHLLVRAHGLAPGLTAELLGVASRFLPAGGDTSAEPGARIQERLRSPVLETATRLGQEAAERHAQH
jgi:NAD(P)-dependent dehydrogenase (short-subunit alcohol dehydrogenase family)